MFFRKQEYQRLNLKAPNVGGASATPGPPPLPKPFGAADPAKVEAVNRKVKEILESGRIPDCLYRCGVGNGTLTLTGGHGQSPMVLLFSSTFATSDYLRVTGAKGTPMQLRVQNLPQFAQSWFASGARSATLDRCPRCPQNPCLTIGLESMTRWTAEDFAKVWAGHRASRLVLGEIRVRSAMQHKATGNHAAALIDLEYVRDHFDCGIPYLHQMIWLYAGMDESVRRTALERLKEFGPEFDIPAEPSAKVLSQFMATATVGLLANFGIVNAKP